MSKTILHEYEKWLKDRMKRGEIVESTRDTYLNDASRVFEVLLRSLPASVIEGYLASAGYRGYYGHVVSALRTLAREPRHTAFKHPMAGQQKLPGIDSETDESAEPSDEAAEAQSDAQPEDKKG